MASWKTCKIGEVVELSQGLAINSKTKHLLVKKSTLPLLKIRNLINGIEEEFVDEVKVSPKCIAVPEDIIYTRTGQVGLVYTGKIGVVHNNCFKVIPNQVLDRMFLYWFLKQPEFLVIANSIASGSVQKDLNHTAFKSIDISFPEDLTTQRRIAEILSALDDKIELNRRMNQTLEQMAQTLFQKYFVKGIDEENLPEGWKFGKIIDLFELQRGYDLPATKRTAGSVPVFAAGGLNGFHNEAMVKGPGITTGRSGVIGNVYYISEDFWPLNTSLFIKKYNASTPLHAFYVLKFTDLKGLNTGSAVPTLNRNEVHSLETIVPAKEAIIKF